MDFVQLSKWMRVRLLDVNVHREGGRRSQFFGGG